MAKVKINDDKMKDKMHKLLDTIGYIIEGEAILHAPVESGRLRASITHKVEENTVTIGTFGIPYAVWVEYGTGSMVAAHGAHDPKNPVTTWEALEKRGGAGQTMPFLRPAMFSKKFEIEQAIKEAFR